jgi:DNA-binding transcriptional MerR regulator
MKMEEVCVSYLKMSELVEQTGVQKSTILYYLKEGLLPAPEKPKPNVYLYPEKTVQAIELIRYMQQTLGAPIADIKEMAAIHDLGESSQMLMVLLEQLSGTRSQEETFDRATFLARSQMDEVALSELEMSGLIVPIRGERYAQRDLEVVALLKRMDAFEPGESSRLGDALAASAKRIAQVKHQEAQRLFSQTPMDKHSDLQRLLIDLALSLEPYLIHRHTLRVFEGNHPAKCAREKKGSE